MPTPRANVKIAPSSKEMEEINRINDEAEKIIAKAKEIADVQTPEAEVRAAEFLKQIKMRVDIAETARKKLVQPLNDHVKMINDEFKKTTVPLKDADLLVRRGMTTYRNSVVFKEAEAKRLQIEAEAKVAVRMGDSDKITELAEEHAEASLAAPRQVQSQSGKARFRKVWRFEIQDLNELPDDYWIPDEKKIKAVVDAGIQIKGVKSWQEEIPMII